MVEWLARLIDLNLVCIFHHICIVKGGVILVTTHETGQNWTVSFFLICVS
jgi:hypothetical protein